MLFILCKIPYQKDVCRVGKLAERLVDWFDKTSCHKTNRENYKYYLKCEEYRHFELQLLIGEAGKPLVIAIF